METKHQNHRNTIREINSPLFQNFVCEPTQHVFEYESPFFSEAQSTTNKQTPILEKNDRNSRILIASYNCKNIKTCGQSINSIFKNNDIVLIQEHWLFHSQIKIISDIYNKIKFAAKGVDIRDPLLPISLPRGYGGVAVLWNMSIDHLIRPILDATEKIQSIELEGFDKNMIIISVYLPAVGSNNHQVKYHECIDELYEIYQKYSKGPTIYLERGGGYVFLFRSELFFRTTRELEYLFFWSVKARNFFQNVTLDYMTKTLNQIIFFPASKSESFFQQHWESEYFFRKKTIPPPTLQVKWSFPLLT